jgi:extracellular factor (EF) 3-hydroxypalmitic acid methyl ester biosynthesis protein
LNEFADFADPRAPEVRPFMAALEKTRSALIPDDWKSLVKTSPVIRSWRFFLSLDPYTRWGLVKPRGYPGDATLMDFAYAHPSIQEHLAVTGSVGLQIYAETSAAQQSQSARERIEFVRGELSERSQGGPFSVASLAAGHARELEGLEAGVASRITSFSAIDNDPESLRAAQTSAAGIPFTAARRNVIKHEFADLPSTDLVYSLGLFDYLADEVAEAVLEKMLRLTARGGRCIVANLASDAANLGYCEAIMDWWMIARTSEQMTRLGRRAAERSGLSFDLQVRQQGCFHYLTANAA